MEQHASKKSSSPEQGLEPWAVRLKELPGQLAMGGGEGDFSRLSIK